MKEKAVGLWNRIATKENKQIAKNVLLILLVSRLFYIFIGCVTNSAFGNNITFAKMFLGGDADWYIKIAEKGYSLSGSIKPGDGQANWAFFPLFPVSIRLFKYIFFFLNYAQAGIFLSLIYVYIMGIFLVKTVRLYKPDRLGYFAVVLVYMGPYSFYLHCVYSETLFMMLIAVFFYYLKKEKGNINNYWISAAAAMLASCTRIVGVILVFPLVLQMYLDLYEGRITFGKLDEEESIMISSWPVYTEDNNYSQDENAIETIKTAVRNIRNLRAEMNVAPSRKALVYIVSENENVRNIFANGKVFFATLGYASEVVIQSDKSGIPEDAVSTVIPDAVIYIPFAELVDIDKEIERLKKEEDKLHKEISRCNGMLNNEKFTSKAPQAKIDEEKAKLEKYSNMLAQVEERLATLSK